MMMDAFVPAGSFILPINSCKSMQIHANVQSQTLNQYHCGMEATKSTQRTMNTSKTKKKKEKKKKSPKRALKT